MKLSLLALSMFIAGTALGCGGNDNQAIAEGNIEKLCKKAQKLMPKEKFEYSECNKKMAALKEKRIELFKKVAKCISEASDSADMKSCNDKENPRYKNP